MSALALVGIASLVLIYFWCPPVIFKAMAVLLPLECSLW